jgi:hypothetical protein
MCLGEASGVLDQEPARLTKERPWKGGERHVTINVGERHGRVLSVQCVGITQAGAQPSQQEEPNHWGSD